MRTKPKHVAQFVVIVDVELAVDLPHMIDDRAVAQREATCDLAVRMSEDERRTQLPLPFGQAELKAEAFDFQFERREMLDMNHDREFTLQCMRARKAVSLETEEARVVAALE